MITDHFTVALRNGSYDAGPPDCWVCERKGQPFPWKDLVLRPHLDQNWVEWSPWLSLKKLTKSLSTMQNGQPFNFYGDWRYNSFLNRISLCFYFLMHHFFSFLINCFFLISHVFDFFKEFECFCDIFHLMHALLRLPCSLFSRQSHLCTVLSGWTNGLNLVRIVILDMK